ncbi:hypothetical protein LTR17_004643 [Elasticomyces elasticus]|nr:hypothetical protein LTR17_004643 [Elasticomyces elasticus]
MQTPSRDLHHPSSVLDTIVDVEVGEGEEKRTFQAHKGLLAFYSSYFEAALNGRFLEANNGVVKLTTEDPATFELFLLWAHTRRFLHDSDLEPTLMVSYFELAALWVFGDAHEILSVFQDEVIDLFALKLQATTERPDAETIDFIWDSTAPSATLRRLLIDFVSMLLETPQDQRDRSARWIESGLEQEASTEWYSEGSTDIKDFMETRPPSSTKTRQWKAYGSPPCRWHIHPTGEKCGAIIKREKDACDEEDRIRALTERIESLELESRMAEMERRAREAEARWQERVSNAVAAAAQHNASYRPRP